MTTTFTTADFRSTMADLLPALSAGRDARIESYPHGCVGIVMDDAGDGEFTRACSDREAEALIREGYCRDAR